MKSGIYKITAPSGRFYIGSAVDLSRRWRKHRNELSNNTHHCAPLQRAALKYGTCALRFEVLMHCAVTDLIVFEQAYIDMLKPAYNVAKVAGSLLGFVRDDALRKKHSDAMRKKWTDPSHRAKVSAAQIGKTPNAITRAKMSESAKHRLLRDGNPRNKPVTCITNGVTYPSATLAGQALGLSVNAQTKISQVCSGRRSSAYGHKWKFAVQSDSSTNVTNGVIKMANERMTANGRTEQLIKVGYEIARTKGIRKVTRAAVARVTGVSDGLINRYLDGREGLRAAVLEHAVGKKDISTLAAAAEHYDVDALTMPEKLRREVKRALAAS